MMKEDEIVIKVMGTDGFRQEIVDRIHELLLSEDLAEKSNRPGCKVEISSTLEPSADVWMG